RGQTESIGQILWSEENPGVSGETVWTGLRVTNAGEDGALVDENGAFYTDDAGRPRFDGELTVEGTAYELTRPPDTFRARRFRWSVRQLENGGTVIASLNTGTREGRVIKAIGADGVPVLELAGAPGRPFNVSGAALDRDPQLRAELVDILGPRLTIRGGETERLLAASERIAPYFGFRNDPQGFVDYVLQFASSPGLPGADYPAAIDPDPQFMTGVRIPGAIER
ncbi:MAG: hypothetical protein AAFY60_12205, partial [Myxococcota bacterium]